MIIYAAGNICRARTKPGITLVCGLLFQQPCFRDSFEKHPVSISLTTGETFRQKTKRMPNLFISVHETLLFLHQNLIILHILTHSHTYLSHWAFLWHNTHAHTLLSISTKYYYIASVVFWWQLPLGLHKKLQK